MGSLSASQLQDPFSKGKEKDPVKTKQNLKVAITAEAFAILITFSEFSNSVNSNSPDILHTVPV